MRILLTGAYGQLGRCLLDRFPADWVMLACGSAELDITDRAAVERIVRRFRPQVIMNTAAYTAVDKAEIDRIRAMKINAIGPENTARAACEVGAQLIHISTDYVFDGSKTTPYIESDLPCPINFYGLSKWEGESACRRFCRRRSSSALHGYSASTAITSSKPCYARRKRTRRSAWLTISAAARPMRAIWRRR